jgi:hypothetical protein
MRKRALDIENGRQSWWGKEGEEEDLWVRSGSVGKGSSFNCCWIEIGVPVVCGILKALLLVLLRHNGLRCLRDKASGTDRHDGTWVRYLPNSCPYNTVGEE